MQSGWFKHTLNPAMVYFEPQLTTLTPALPPGPDEKDQKWIVNKIILIAFVGQGIVLSFKLGITWVKSSFIENHPVSIKLMAHSFSVDTIPLFF